ncbi:MAG: 4Fe-4S binding protein [Bilifractor sp.]|jgi:Fe-S-cluster-containing hydrogenase component 2
MLKECKKDGVLTKEVLSQIPGYRMDAVYAAKGPVVVIECAEHIPCNPCATSCPQHAITVGEPITNLPSVDPEKCVGCGMCVAVCPGLAIFLLNAHFAEGRGSLTFAYEYLPVPKKGDIVRAVNRVGEYVCDAVVEKVVCVPAYDQTRVMTISFPVEYLEEVRAIERKKGAD